MGKTIFPLRSGRKQGYLLSLLVFNTKVYGLATAIQQEQKTKDF
jgi:hypothetical protein